MSAASQRPKVTVVIPAFNRAQTIEACLASLQNQTVEDWEAIVVDDGSSDGTLERVQVIADSDRRMTFVRRTTNRGAQAARNAGISRARGRWVGFLDSDDTWLPESLALRLAAAEDREVHVVHSECFVLRKPGEAKLFGVPPLDGQVYKQLLTRPGPLYQTLLVAREALESIGPLDESVVAYQEWDTSIRLARRYEFAFVPEPTFVYDCTNEGTISQDWIKNANGFEKVVRKHRWAMLRHVGPRELSRHYREAAARHTRAGSTGAVVRCALISLTLWPFDLRPAARYLLRASESFTKK